MKNITKRILLVSGLLISTFLIVLAGVFLKLKSEIKKMTPVGTGHIADKVYAIQDEIVNVYLIQSKEGYIMIDAGNDIHAVEQGLSELNIEKREIIAVFLTHSDYDHIDALPLFENARIFLHQQEEQMIDGQKPRLVLQYNKLDIDNYERITDGQLFNFTDVRIKCIHVPGHTPGTTCYLVNDKYLFTGDALSLQNGLVKEFLKLATMDMTVHRKSIDKISALPNIEYLFTAHHGISSDFTLAFSDWGKEN